MSKPGWHPYRPVLDGVHLARPAQRGDVETIVALWRDLQNANAAADRRLEISSDAPSLFRAFLGEQIENGSAAVLVAEDDFGSVVGYIIGQIVSRPTLRKSRCGFIADICVAPHVRRQGFGRALYNTLHAWFSQQGVTELEAQAVSSNQDSIAFWRAMGFDSFLQTLRAVR